MASYIASYAVDITYFDAPSEVAPSFIGFAVIELAMLLMWSVRATVSLTWLTLHVVGYGHG